MLTFRPYKNQDYSLVSQFIVDFYTDDPSAYPMTQDKIDLTLKTLGKRPDLGEIIIMDLDKKTVGYSLLINYWSNEFGGMIVNIDELFIDAPYRNKGFASQFFEYLIARANHEVAFELEVTPNNDKAMKLYQRLGFEMDKNRHLFFEK